MTENPLQLLKLFQYIGFSVWTELSGPGSKSHSDQLSIATSINFPIFGEYDPHQFILPNLGDCLRPKYTYFSPKQIIR